MPHCSLDDPHFASTDPELLRIWDDLQRWQTDFCFPLELCAYYTSDSWIRSRTVLDVGTGNGYYLGKIIDLFPSKSYTGIDSSAEFIEIARGSKVNGEFYHASLFDWTGQYDFLLLRLLLQHLPDTQRVLNHLASLTSPGGSALIVDACDSVRYFFPPLPPFVNFFNKFRAHESSKSRNRDAVVELATTIRSNAHWVIGASFQVIIPSSIPGNQELFRKTYRRVVDMVEKAGEMQYDFDSVRRAWDDWCADASSYNQVGLTLTRLDRK